MNEHLFSEDSKFKAIIDCLLDLTKSELFISPADVRPKFTGLKQSPDNERLYYVIIEGVIILEKPLVLHKAIYYYQMAHYLFGRHYNSNSRNYMLFIEKVIFVWNRFEVLTEPLKTIIEEYKLK